MMELLRACARCHGWQLVLDEPIALADFASVLALLCADPEQAQWRRVCVSCQRSPAINYPTTKVGGLLLSAYRADPGGAPGEATFQADLLPSARIRLTEGWLRPGRYRATAHQRERHQTPRFKCRGITPHHAHSGMLYDTAQRHLIKERRWFASHDNV
jgi:hypothetical protein